MRSLLLQILVPLVFLLFSGVQTTKTVSGNITVAVTCGPESESKNITVEGRIMVALPGWGNHHFAISTRDDSAQFFFDQGLSMYYSYHWREANASFREAARFDTSCAMAYWGQLLARGPTYNFAHQYKMPNDLPALVDKMNSLKGTVPAREQRLLEAMSSRYSTDLSDRDRKGLNQAYGDKMKAVAEAYNDDLDILALYIDAVMLQHPWNFWNNDGTPKEWTPEVVQLSEKVLARNPQHPGVLHYYIHITEASREPERATASADILKDLLPGVAHMVHMSSHVYERNGSYAKGVEVNESADRDLLLYDSLVQGLGSITLSKHVPHYFAVQTYCALSGGMYRKGMPLAYRLRNSISPDRENTYLQYLYMMPVLAQVRMGKWKEILADKNEIPDDWPYAQLLSNFAKGMGSLRLGNIKAAKGYLEQLRENSKDTVLKQFHIPFNSPSQSAYIADKILNGSILFAEKRFAASFEELHEAIKMEDNLVYIEPKDWVIPVRQYMGAYLMKLKRFSDAEKIYLEDLQWNPGNGWSLLGLAQSLEAQGRRNEASQHRQASMNSFSAADEIPRWSAY